MKKYGCWPWSLEPGDLDNASESGGSSEDYKSPRSVRSAGEEEEQPKGGSLVHNQLLRIKEEDLHLGEDDNKVNIWNHRGGGGGRVFAILTARPVLPCSPLSGRAITRTASI